MNKFDFWACEENYLTRYMDCIYNADLEDIRAVFGISEEIEENGISSIDGNTATIRIAGLLTSEPLSKIARFFGFNGTSYPEIKEALLDIGSNDSVENVILEMDTPGGHVSGVDEIAQLVSELGKSKKVTAVNTGMMASAGYWIGSQANKIFSTAPSNETGSIGVLAVGIDSTEYQKKIGIKKVTVVSKNAPEKAADVDSKKGIESLQKRLDALERVFVSRVAAGRKVKSETVISDFGKGNVFVDSDPDPGKPDSIKVGMVDGLIKSAFPSSEENGGEMFAVNEDILAGATTFKDFPIVDKPWDSTAADKRVRMFTKSTDKPSADYRNAFFWYDSKAADKFGSYKLPFVDIVNGKMVAIRRGVFAAKGAMAGARGGVAIPASDKAAVNAHIDKYVRKIEKEDRRKEKNAMSLDDLIAENPGLAAEIDRIKSAAFEAGKVAGIEAEKNRINAIVPHINSDLPDSIKAMVGKALEGSVSVDTLKGAIAYHESVVESEKAKAAVEDTEAAGDTKAEGLPNLSPDGIVRTEDDFQAAVEKFNRTHG